MKMSYEQQMAWQRQVIVSEYREMQGHKVIAPEATHIRQKGRKKS